MKLAPNLLLAALGKTFARPFGARRNLKRKKKKCIYETGFHSDLLIHEKLRSEIIVKADFKSAIIIEKKETFIDQLETEIVIKHLAIRWTAH